MNKLRDATVYRPGHAAEVVAAGAGVWNAMQGVKSDVQEVRVESIESLLRLSFGAGPIADTARAFLGTRYGVSFYI